MSKIRRFRLVREEDESGVSGTGVVAVGAQFPSGFIHIEWLNDANDNLDTSRNGIAQYPGAETEDADSVENAIRDVEKVHGHGGRTTIEWVDTE